MDATPSQEIDIEELYNNISPQTTHAPSVAKWLVPILTHHKFRIITLTKNSELGRLTAEKLQSDLQENKFPTFMEHLKPLKALEDYPGLQEVWDNIHTKYKTELTQLS